MKISTGILLVFLCIAVVLTAGCANNSSDPAVGTYTEKTTGKSTFSLNGDGTFNWKFPYYTVNGRWERVDQTTIKLDGKVESSGGKIPVPATITFNPTDKTLQIGSMMYDSKGASGGIKQSKIISFTAQSIGNMSEIHKIRVINMGGQNVPDLVSYQIKIDNKTTVVVNDKTIGKETEIPNMSPGSHIVVITATFTDGTTQFMFGHSA